MRYLVAMTALVLSVCVSRESVAYGQTMDAPLKVGSDTPSPKQLKGEKPVYPETARKDNLRGVVVLELLIDPAGKVGSVKVLRAVSGLTEAAVAAAKKWEYEPTKAKGKPAWVSIVVTVPFP